jgi:hypothetical protein
MCRSVQRSACTVSRGLTCALAVGLLVASGAAPAFALDLMGQRSRGTATRTNSGATTENVPAPPVQVLVSKEAHADSIIYRYLLVNGGAFPIAAIRIGYNYFYDMDELTLAPMGWDWDSMPPGGATCPPGWDVRMFGTEEENELDLEWRITSDEHCVMGGSSLAGFSVTVPPPGADAYENGHWTVYLCEGEEGFYCGAIEPDNVTSVPSSSVFARSGLEVTPNPAAGSAEVRFDVLAAGVATIEVFDAGGRLVRRLPKLATNPGTARTTWDGRDSAGHRVPAGAYFVRVTTGAKQRFAKVVLVR